MKTTTKLTLTALTALTLAANAATAGGGDAMSLFSNANTAYSLLSGAAYGTAMAGYAASGAAYGTAMGSQQSMMLAAQDFGLYGGSMTSPMANSATMGGWSSGTSAVLPLAAAAYESPAYSTAKMQEREIAEFSNTHMLECMKNPLQYLPDLTQNAN